MATELKEKLDAAMEIEALGNSTASRYILNVEKLALPDSGSRLTKVEAPCFPAAMTAMRGFGYEICLLTLRTTWKQVTAGERRGPPFKHYYVALRAATTKLNGGQAGVRPPVDLVPIVYVWHLAQVTAAGTDDGCAQQMAADTDGMTVDQARWIISQTIRRAMAYAINQSKMSPMRAAMADTCLLL
jgi:hypothetical protein